MKIELNKKFYLRILNWNKWKYNKKNATHPWEQWTQAKNISTLCYLKSNFKITAIPSTLSSPTLKDTQRKTEIYCESTTKTFIWPTLTEVSSSRRSLSSVMSKIRKRNWLFKNLSDSSSVFYSFISAFVEHSQS